jgi:MscS family membrane protein
MTSISASSVARRSADPGIARAFGAVVLFLLAVTLAWAQPAESPLKPPDRSSPRATLKTFLDACDAITAFIAQEYIPAPSSAKFGRMVDLSAVPVESLDVAALPPAARLKGSRAAALSLYEVLSRIELPPLDRIPDAKDVAAGAGGGLTRWVVPDTEIALVRVQAGPRSGEWVFSPDTVARAGEFYDRVRHLPYRRPVPMQGAKELVVSGGGWMIPHGFVQSMPAALRAPLADQAVWKWIGLGLILVLAVVFVGVAYRVSQLGADRNRFLNALAELALPASILIAAPVVAYLALVQLNLIDEPGVVVGVVATEVMFLAAAWLSWRIAPVVAEAIIASPNIGPESIDAHLIRVTARLLAIVGSASFIALGAERLGAPVYGIVAGLGVGGLAIALAAQPTIENLIGGLNLFADKPIRVGDVCKYGTDIGTVEAIGIRSTRIRGADRTLTTIPNAALAKMPIVNLTRRDRILIQTVIGLRYETTPEQLRYVLVRLRELLLGHPRVEHGTARARLAGFGGSSLDIEVFAYVATRDWAEFLGIREDILLRIMDVIEEGGAALAFPSQTLYLGRDGSRDGGKAEAAEAAVRAWRDAGSLPFPNFSPERARALRESVAFPPPGSTDSPAARE